MSNVGSGGAGAIGHLTATIGADISQLRADMAAATKLIQDASDKMTASATKAANSWEKVGKSMKRAGQQMSLAITTPLVAAATYAFKQASDSAEWLNRVRVAFENSSKSVEEFSTTTLKSIGLASNTTMEYTGMIGDMATSMGLGRAEAAKLSIGMVDLAGDMSSLKNKEIGQVMEALTGIFTGQIRPLRSLGVIMTVNAIKAYMLSQGITKMYKDLTQAELIMIRYNYILSVTKNSQGDFARTFNLAANQTRLFGQNLKEVALSFGNELLPMILPVIVKLNNMLTAVTQLDAPTKKFIVVIGGIVAALGPLLVILGYMTVNVIPGVVIIFAKLGAAMAALVPILAYVGTAIKTTSIMMTTMRAVLGTTVIPTIAQAATALGVFALVLIAIGAAIYLYTNRTTELEKVQKKAAKAAEQATESLKQEQAAQSVSIQLAMEYEQGSAGRVRALNKINTIYPDLLKNLNTETVTNEQLNTVLKKVNSSYKEKIELAAQEAKRGSIFDEQVKAQMKIDDLLTKRIALQEKLDKADEIDAKLNKGYYNPDDMGAFQAAFRSIFNVKIKDDLLFQMGMLDKSIEKAKEEAGLLSKELGKLPNPIIKNTVNGWLQFTTGIQDAILAAIALEEEKKAGAKAQYAALGIIGRLEEDLKNAKEGYTKSQSIEEQKLYQRKIGYIESELKKYEDMYSKMKKLKPKDSEGSKLEGVRFPMMVADPKDKSKVQIEWGVKVVPQLDASVFTDMKKQIQDKIKEANKDGIEYSMKIIPTPNTDILKFWDDYESQMEKVTVLNEEFNDQDVFNVLSERMNVVNDAITNASALFGENSMQVAWLIDWYKKLGVELDALTAEQEAWKDSAQTIGNSVGNVFSQMGDQIVASMGEASSALEGFVFEMIKAFWRLMGTLLANSIAQTISNSAVAAGATGAAAPVTLPIYIAEGVGAVMAAFAAIPKFKDGGIVSGPTMGIMGEYPGAKSNPEVVTPLDRLKKLIGGNDTEDITVHGRLIGADLYVSNQRFQKRKTLIQ